MIRIFYDIETAPNVMLAWRPGWKISLSADNIIEERFIICICFKYEGDDTVYYLTCDENNNDEEMVDTFAEILNEADEIVAHNGDRFDLPWIKGRCFERGVPMSPHIKTVDTLAWAKKMGLNSNRLDYISKYRFGGGKTPTNFDMWKRIVIEKDQDTVMEMVDYCVNDVLLQEDAFNALAPYNLPKTHLGVLKGGEKWHCPYTGSDNVKTSKKRVTAAGTVKWQMINKDTGNYFTINDKSHRDYLEATKKTK